MGSPPHKSHATTAFTTTCLFQKLSLYLLAVPTTRKEYIEAVVDLITDDYGAWHI